MVLGTPVEYTPSEMGSNFSLPKFSLNSECYVVLNFNWSSKPMMFNSKGLHDCQGPDVHRTLPTTYRKLMLAQPCLGILKTGHHSHYIDHAEACSASLHEYGA